ncbi:MAG: flagellar FliJ family protein [Steroidobacteraceae bacterium]|jgi:flagellar export protein FliJ|nr:flagellar FliJ family protein [Steroidobacteraceae bacterium]
MSEPHFLKSLGRLADLRAREVERLSADFASREATRSRFLGNLARLEKLCETSGASGAPLQTGRSGLPGARLSPSLSLNCGSYKQAVLRMAHAHRVDLALHEADMAIARRALIAAARRRDAINKELARQQRTVRRSQNTREQKRQDDLALEVWRRGRK